MSQPTQRYKRTLSGSVGSGVKSILGSSDRRYYVLEHKVSTKYHKAGESQKILIDQIELGRDPKCQIRFDESFDTVSRRHAAIVKDGDNWKLIQLSKTNSTYLNGRKVEKEWYLQSGDEIQLSTNGPKMGFIVPQGDKGKIGSLPLTVRMNLAMGQALRPYKQVVMALSCILLLTILGGGYTIYSQQQVIIGQGKIVADGEQAIKKLIGENEGNQELIAQLMEKLEGLGAQTKAALLKAAAAEKRASEIANRRDVVVSGFDMSSCHPHIYFIKCYKITCNEETIAETDDWLFCGTGFMLNDGKFVTARHVSDPLYYSNEYKFDENGVFRWLQGAEESVATWVRLNMVANEGIDVVFYFKANSPTNSFTFSSKDFACDRSKDRVYVIEKGINLTWRDKKGTEQSFNIPSGAQIRMGSGGFCDWAYIQTSGQTGLAVNRELSVNLKQGTPLYVLGYPSGRGEGNPVLSEAMCAQNGLDVDGTIMASNNNTEGGNSGGPIFINDENGPQVVAIVSGRTTDKGRFVPIKVIP